MYNIAVIGAGELGSRHLQGLACIGVPATLFMVDPVPEAINRAQQRFVEMPENSNIKGLVSYSELAELPAEIDLVIMATTANVRAQLLERLLEQCQVKYLILEKVLFQREEEYPRAADLLASRGTSAWVNCPRRLYDIYGEVREFFVGERLKTMQVHGGDWGLGCNGIHFADLFTYLTGNLVESYDSHLLDSGSYPSKRVAFVEFGGSLIGRGASVQLWLSAQHGSVARHLVMLRGENRSCMIDEVAGQAWFLDQKEGWRTGSFSCPYQSQMTGELALAILQSGSCGLPDFAESAAIHLPFIRALTNHLAPANLGLAVCPIT